MTIWSKPVSEKHNQKMKIRDSGMSNEGCWESWSPAANAERLFIRATISRQRAGRQRILRPFSDPNRGLGLPAGMKVGEMIDRPRWHHALRPVKARRALFEHLVPGK